MNFQLPFSLKKTPFKISLGDQFISIGSCFSSNLSVFLSKYKFKTTDNPFGVIYNPVSIISCLINAIDNIVDEDLILERDGIYYYYLAHSEIHANSKEELINQITAINNQVRNNLTNSNFLILTLGTAWAFEIIKQNQIVANCHKQPNQNFRKQFLTAEHCLPLFEDLFKKIQKLNTDLKVIISVSPVRHTREGLSENAVSKGELIKLCLALKDRYSHLYYFEAYELVIDVLRDYRFYEKDLIHPSSLGIEFVLEQFRLLFFDTQSSGFYNTWTKLLNDLSHRPHVPTSVHHQNFIKSLIQKLEQLPYSVDVKNEIEKLKETII